MQIDRRIRRRWHCLFAVVLMILSPAGPTRAQDTLSPESQAALGPCETAGDTATVSGYGIASNGVPAGEVVERLYTAQGCSPRYTTPNLNRAFSMVGVKGGACRPQVIPPRTTADQVEWTDDQIDRVTANDLIVADGATTCDYRLGSMPGISSNRLALHSAAAALSLPRLERPVASPSTCVDPPGYRPQSFTGQAALTQATTVPVTAPLTTMNFDVVLSRGIFLPEITR
jgi:hypothetical protein